ncbi:MAG: KH domain-containing protein [Candidatus Nezhaarchaeota archaeon]|nr:KH domain-containing protein [Candidatus Nezhaarchaeota archaeon]
MVIALWGTVYKDYVQVPMDRIGVLIGKGGAVKKEIEETYNVKLDIDSSTGTVCIELLENSNPSSLLTVKNIVQAIGCGINPNRALEVFSSEDGALHVIDLKNLARGSRDNLVRIKGRIIGEKGKARRLIEELTNASISISENTVTIVGKLENVEIARRAVEMLISGSPHNVVWKYLYKMRRELKRRGFILWEPKSPSLEGKVNNAEKARGEEDE